MQENQNQFSYQKYLDDLTRLTPRGHIDSSQQQAMPQSAGSRGLKRTTDFTKGPTQMKMGHEDGNTPIAESMVEIRNILNRIDGISVPVVEDDSKPIMRDPLDSEQAKDMQKTEYEGSMDYELSGDDGEMAYGTIHYKTINGVVDPNSLEGSYEYNGDHKVDDEYATQMIQPGGEEHEEALKAAQEDYEYEAGRMKSKFEEDEPGYYKNPDKEFNINGMTTKKDVVQSIIDNLDNNELDTAKDSLNQLLDVVTALHDDYQPMPEGDEFDIEEDEDFEEVLGSLGFPEDETELFDAEYQGRKVPLNKPMRGDSKKFKVYVKDPKTGNVKKVNFGHGGTSAKKLGQKTMKIRKSNPKARKSFRARHNCANPGPKTKARYWSCRKW